MTLKKCKDCCRELPYECYHKSLAYLDGFDSRCKDCRNSLQRKIRHSNLEKTRMRNRESYHRNKEAISIRRKEKFSVPENIEKRKEYMNNYYANPLNKQKSIISKQKSLLKNKDKNLERKHAWRREYDKRRRQEPEYRLTDNMRRRLRSFLKGNPKPSTTMNLVGCSVTELKEHIEKQFLPGMTWENYGKVWHIDHIVMLKEFNVLDEKELRLAFHFTNLRPLWAKDNVSKKFNLPRQTEQTPTDQ